MHLLFFASVSASCLTWSTVLKHAKKECQTYVLKCFVTSISKGMEFFLPLLCETASTKGGSRWNDRKKQMFISHFSKNTLDVTSRYNMRAYLWEKIDTALCRDTQSMRWNSSSFRQQSERHSNTRRIMEFFDEKRNFLFMRS